MELVSSCFLKLRGAPFLLSPADFLILDAWCRQGVPASLAIGALEKVFRARAERGERGSVPLAYCRPAVEDAWEELREMIAPALRGGESMAEAILRFDRARMSLVD